MTDIEKAEPCWPTSCDYCKGPLYVGQHTVFCHKDECIAAYTAAKDEEIAKWKDNYQTALDAWNNEITLRQTAERQVATLREALFVICQLCDGCAPIAERALRDTTTIIKKEAQ